MNLKVDDALSLEFLDETHSTSLFNLVNTNRDHLKVWLPWVDHMQEVGHARNYILNCIRQAAGGTDFAYAILSENKMVGRIGIHHINQQNKIGEIGYWLADGLQGRGIVTKCCKALINYGFTELGLNRIEIKCATGNEKSRAIPEKLNFIQEGILRQAEELNGGFVDLYLYSKLKEEWEMAGKK